MKINDEMAFPVESGGQYAGGIINPFWLLSSESGRVCLLIWWAVSYWVVYEKPKDENQA